MFRSKTQIAVVTPRHGRTCSLHSRQESDDALAALGITAYRPRVVAVADFGLGTAELSAQDIRKLLNYEPLHRDTELLLSWCIAASFTAGIVEITTLVLIRIPVSLQQK